MVVKRDDLNHDVVQGNKLRKLKYNLLAAESQQAKTVVTFGGAYSNHLVATAYAAGAAGLDSVGFVRGDELAQKTSTWSDTLNHCHQLGMKLVFVTRQDYRLKTNSKHIAQEIASIRAPYVLPEGGSNALAINGMSEMIAELKQQTIEPTHLICPVGTGGTFAGLVKGVAESSWNCKIYGIGVLKGLQPVKNKANQWLSAVDNKPEHQILTQFDGGGYAKNTQELISFSLAFEQETGIRLDKIYNSKAFYALAQLIKNKQIRSHDKPLIIHTGGLQGGVNQAPDLT